MAETERIDQPKQASQDEAPRMDCPTCHVSHVGPTAEALRSRLSSVERDERVERLARNIEDAFNSALESGNTTREALAFALDQALPWGVVPSPDGLSSPWLDGLAAKLDRNEPLSPREGGELLEAYRSLLTAYHGTQTLGSPDGGDLA